MSVAGTCLVCGKAIPPSRRRPRKYCVGNACGARASYRRQHGLPIADAAQPPRRSKRRHGPRVTLTCAGCGEPFEVTPSDARAGRKYHSRECFYRHVASEDIPRICEQCSKPFMARRAYVARGQGQFCGRECAVEAKRLPTPRVNKSGYLYQSKRGTRETLVHRQVFEVMRGEPFQPGETVHHLNGIRTDNRPENLELWLSSHPSGQRIEDHVAWAREILLRYDGFVQPRLLVAS